MKIERAKKMIQQLAEIWGIPKPKYFFYERLSKAPRDTRAPYACRGFVGIKDGEPYIHFYGKYGRTKNVIVHEFILHYVPLLESLGKVRYTEEEAEENYKKTRELWEKYPGANGYLAFVCMSL